MARPYPPFADQQDHTMSARILFPTCCPVCSSRKIAVYMLDGSWSCWQCGTDSSDTAPLTPKQAEADDQKHLLLGGRLTGCVRG